MPDFTTLLQNGASNPWLFIPSAILLGALHGLEPGHSKTLMAAFIVAVRGTFPQAILLGLAATLSHTAVVWIVALAGLYFGQHENFETREPYFQVASAVIIIGIAVWMIWQTWRQQHLAQPDHHSHMDTSSSAYQDSHEKAHAEDIQQRFANKHVTTGQIIIFGLTGGLIPCPASITVLLLCLQLKKIALGATLVLSFSIGLALTLIASGTLAALSVKHVSKHWNGFGEYARKAPYVSGVLIMLVGCYVGYHGLQKLI